jgi:hypothetical protein
MIVEIRYRPYQLIRLKATGGNQLGIDELNAGIENGRLSNVENFSKHI